MTETHPPTPAHHVPLPPSDQNTKRESGKKVQLQNINAGKLLPVPSTATQHQRAMSTYIFLEFKDRAAAEEAVRQRN
ncbi:hypothetical protein O3P69_000531 [Scylla paramamosain]|uniref:Uncharacterized protein n=1 Tax=Scylla paramamosain TaxID=85552 RepID=A0AAW0UTU1_SCYPA